MPPALVASTPPIWQLPSDAKLKGNSRPALAATLAHWRARVPLDRHGVAVEIDVADMGHAAQAHHHFMTALERDLTADETGIAALRHRRRAVSFARFKTPRLLP